MPVPTQKQLAETFNLSPASAKLMRLLMVRNVATNEHIEKALEGCVVKVSVMRLRAQLKRARSSCKIKSKRFVGYWLDPRDKAYVVGRVG